MSLIATKPSSALTWSPSRYRLQKRQSSCGVGKDPLLGDGLCADMHQFADRRVDEPRRVVVAVAAPRTVDEHDVLLLARPPAQAELVREDRKSTRLNSSHANISYA